MKLLLGFDMSLNLIPVLFISQRLFCKLSEQRRTDVIISLSVMLLAIGKFLPYNSRYKNAKKI